MRRILDEDVLPSLKQGFRNMKLPVDSFEESHLVGVDLLSLQS